MNTNKNLQYGVVALVAAGIALVAGVPAYLLLVLICPVMMFFMMASMSGGNDRRDADTQNGQPNELTKTHTPDGSHDRL
ncbi:MAG: DUF2933 domain-containing protein [Marmoricola sp.]